MATSPVARGGAGDFVARSVFRGGRRPVCRPGLVVGRFCIGFV